MTTATSPHLSKEAFTFIAGLLYRHSRIRIGPDKQALMISRVVKRLRQLELTSFDEYCDLIQSPGGVDEIHNLVDVMSTNHTHFFREREHFDYVTSKILPEWTGRKRTTAPTFRAWSAACSSGEEPYTIGITLAEFARTGVLFEWHIDASDICTRILEKAKTAVYELERTEPIGRDQLARYFQKGAGRYEGCCRVKRELHSHVTFHHLNLFQEHYPVAPGLDLIFCRNVMIYFDQESIHTLVNRLAQSLAPGGHLIVGLSESLLGISHPLTQVRPGIYRKA